MRPLYLPYFPPSSLRDPIKTQGRSCLCSGPRPPMRSDSPGPHSAQPCPPSMTLSCRLCFPSPLGLGTCCPPAETALPSESHVALSLTSQPSLKGHVIRDASFADHRVHTRHPSPGLSLPPVPCCFAYCACITNHPRIRWPPTAIWCARSTDRAQWGGRVSSVTLPAAGSGRPLLAWEDRVAGWTLPEACFLSGGGCRRSAQTPTRGLHVAWASPSTVAGSQGWTPRQTDTEPPRSPCEVTLPVTAQPGRPPGTTPATLPSAELS